MENGRSIDRGVSGEPDTKAFNVTREITLRFETQDDYRTREASHKHRAVRFGYPDDCHNKLHA